MDPTTCPARIIHRRKFVALQLLRDLTHVPDVNVSGLSRNMRASHLKVEG
jgi:hypothetical protein